MFHVSDLPDQDPNKKIEYEFKAVDLVKWIREEYDDYFTIAVAGLYLIIFSYGLYKKNFHININHTKIFV